MEKTGVGAACGRVSKKAYCVFFDFLSGHMSGIGFLEQLDLRQTGQVGKNRLQASLRNAAWGRC